MIQVRLKKTSKNGWLKTKHDLKPRKQTLKSIFKVKSKVFLYPGMAGGHFVYVPKKQSEEIKKTFGTPKRGWGSIPVIVAIGKNIFLFEYSVEGAPLAPLSSSASGLAREREGGSSAFAFEPRTFPLGRPWLKDERRRKPKPQKSEAEATPQTLV